MKEFLAFMEIKDSQMTDCHWTLPWICICNINHMNSYLTSIQIHGAACQVFKN